EPVGGPPHDLEGSQCRIFRDDRADHGDSLCAKRCQFVDECDPNAQQIEVENLFHHGSTQENLVLERRGGENFVHNDDGLRRRLLQNGANPYQVVLELAAEIFNFLLTLEMGEEVVEEEELRISARHRAADAGEVMQLAEGASEGCFAALVRTADDDDPLLASQEEIIADDRGVGVDELFGQRQIEPFVNVDLLRFAGDVRIAEPQSSAAQFCGVFEVGDVKMNLAIEGGNRFIDEAGVSCVVVVEP